MTVIDSSTSIDSRDTLKAWHINDSIESGDSSDASKNSDRSECSDSSDRRESSDSSDSNDRGDWCDLLLFMSKTFTNNKSKVKYLSLFYFILFFQK